MMKRSLIIPSRRRKGYVMVTLAAAGFALMGAVGLAIDMGRLFATKTETQAYTDAAALAAALELDGGTTGITNAKTAVTKTNNTWNFNTKTMSTPTVEFATSASGPWSSNPSSPAGYTYARVVANVNAPLGFMPMVMPSAGRKYVQSVASKSIAGQVPITTFPRGLAPYTAVSTNTTGPRFGLTVGQQYSLQWPQYNGTRAGCNQGNPENCFNANPCAGDSKESAWAVAQNWGSNYNGYWGFSSNQDIKLSILDGLQTQPVYVGMNIAPILTNGNKAAQANILDQRVGQDEYNGNNDVSAYLTDPTHNGRRLLVVPIVNPEAPGTSPVLGFGEFMLISNGASSNYYMHESNGNSPFCAIYVGPYVLNSDNPGGATSGTGGYRVRLVE